MGVKIAAAHGMSSRQLREVFCDTLMDMAAEDGRLVLLDADLMSSAGTKAFAAAYPERTFDCGVQEANMIGVAAGLSVRGFVPFAHSFGSFASRRACDQIFVSCAYAKQNVKIVGSTPGIASALNGGTHTAFEDLGIMAGIPGVTAAEPCDAVALGAALRLAKDSYGVWYLRLHRNSAPAIYAPGSVFEAGRANLLREGRDVTIIAMGYLVAEALRAAEALEEEGISARVLDMWCLKPLDEDAVAAAAEETGALVTAENHNVRTGLGAAVASALALRRPAPLETVGARDEFGEVGPVSYLAERFKLTAEEIARKAKLAVGRKKA